MKQKKGRRKQEQGKGGGRPGHGSWASRGVFRPETFTNEVRNFSQLFVASIPIFAALRLAKMSAIQERPTPAGGSAGARRARCDGRKRPSGWGPHVARERGTRVWRPTGADGEIRPEVRAAAAPWQGASRSARPCWPWVPPQRLQQAQDDRRQLRERP